MSSLIRVPFRPADEAKLGSYRGYDPQLEGWLSSDPLGLKEGPNLYAHVYNRPVNFFEPPGPNGIFEGEWKPWHTFVLA